MTDPTTTSDAAAPSAPAFVPTTLSEAMNCVAAEALKAGTPFKSGAALQAVTEERYPALISTP